MTTPEPVSPTSPVRISSDTTEGSTLAAMSATEPGSRVMAGETGANSNDGSVVGAGSRPAANTPMAAPTAPITSAVTSTPMIADGRSRRSNSACRRVNRSAGDLTPGSGRSGATAGGPNRAPDAGSRQGSSGGRPIPCSPGARPNASARYSGTGGAPSLTGPRDGRGPKGPATPPGRA